MTIMRVKKINLTDQVYSQLKRSLLTGEWTEGTRIPSENTLCKEFSVSRVVVREALQMLRAEKLIVTRHGMGTFAANPGNFLPTNQVFNLSEESYRNFLDFRNAVEIAAVKLGSKRATEADYRPMAANEASIISIFTAMNAVPDSRSFAVPSHRMIMENIKSGEVSKVVAAYRDMGKYNLTRLNRFFRKEEAENRDKESAIG